MNTLFPIFVKLDAIQTLLVGGGNVGLEKLSAMLNNSPNAHITIVADRFLEETIELSKKHPNITVIERSFECPDLDKKHLVILATDNQRLHQQIKQIAEQRHLMVNVADIPDLCDYYLGSIVQKGDLKIAISTNGRSPTMAKRLKQFLNDIIPDDIQESLENMYALRKNIKGDFQEKIKQLNELTKNLIQNQ